MQELTGRVPTEYLAVAESVSEHYRYLFSIDGAGKAGHTLQERLEWAQLAGFSESTPKTVLDIGAGAGLWCWLLKELGHAVTPSNPPAVRGLDISYRHALNALGFDSCFELKVERFVPLDLPKKFDAITALKPAFYDGWEVAEWEFFLADVVKYLTVTGQVFLYLNHTGGAEAPLAFLRGMKLPPGWFWENPITLRYQRVLTVACVFKSGEWKPSKMGDGYTYEHVNRLHSSVAEHLTVPHRFVCLSDVSGPFTIPLLHGWPGWWSKFELFRPGLFSGPVLYIDLDTDIVGNIDHMVQHEGFTALRNLSSGKKGRMGSGIMFWTETPVYLYETFARRPEHYMAEYAQSSDRWGDQGFIQEHLKGGFTEWQDLFPNQIRSFKLSPPHTEDRIICYHGKGKEAAFNRGGGR